MTCGARDRRSARRAARGRRAAQRAVNLALTADVPIRVDSKLFATAAAIDRLEESSAYPDATADMAAETQQRMRDLPEQQARGRGARWQRNTALRGRLGMPAEPGAVCARCCLSGDRPSRGLILSVTPDGA